MTKPQSMRFLAALAALFLVPLLARAECPDERRVAQEAAAFFAKAPTKGYGKGLSVEDAYCAQERYLALLEKRLGPRVGYKVGFTGRAAQEKFGVKEPARGVLFRSMLLPDGAEIEAAFGARPLFEGDLVVTVKDEGINDAKTPLEAARHLDEVVPFIELPDVIVAEGEPLDGPGIIALNVMARYGVIGKGVKVQPTEAFVQAFAEMDAIVTDEKGVEIERAKGSSLMGNPLNVVLWLVEHLKQHGQKLRAGDYLSLGSLGRIFPPQPGRTITLRYEGLPGGPVQTRVRFR